MKDNFLDTRASIPEALKVKDNMLIDTSQLICDCFMQAVENDYSWLKDYDWNKTDYSKDLYSFLYSCIIKGGGAVYTLGYLSGARAIRVKNKEKTEKQ